MRAFFNLTTISLFGFIASLSALAADESIETPSRPIPTVVLDEAETPLQESPDFPTKVDRRPGILAAPSEVPTGDQAYLYEGLGETKNTRNLSIPGASDTSEEE